ncbi:hypothetical protein FB446DRAFT_258200 [Lentinula raphanica]|nr:hypothetical protein FB446DRAFT_258200 [Lentinula raphanica]
MFRIVLKPILALLAAQALLLGASATCTSNSDVPAVKFAAQTPLQVLILPDAFSLVHLVDLYANSNSRASRLSERDEAL